MVRLASVLMTSFLSRTTEIIVMVIWQKLSKSNEGATWDSPEEVL